MNFVLLGLTFVPAFSGIGPTRGVADRLWGDIRLGGWRADVVWMCGTTILIAAGVMRWTGQPGAQKTTCTLCLFWLPCFAFYLAYIVMHMFG